MKCVECGAAMMRTDSGLICERGCGKIFPFTAWTIPNVIPPGSSVRFGDGLEGVVVAIMLQAAGRLTYQVAHWIKGDRKLDWLDDCEVALSEPTTDPIAIGFATGTAGVMQGALP